MAAFDSSFHADGFRAPDLQDLREMNSEMRLMCSEKQLEEMTAMAQEMTGQYQKVVRMVDTTVSRVSYPRTPGWRPAHEDNPYNAWAWRCDILGAATGRLAGRTVAIKDNTAVAGVPLRCGSRVLEHYVPEFDATVVTRILEAGGRIVGKTAVDDLCFSSSSVGSCDGPVRNPLDEARSAGGSSSGSAVLVASGHVDMAIGGDQDGSIRIPASFTGTVGLKPTWGLVPYTGAVPMEPTVDHLGPMAKTVADCALLLEIDHDVSGKKIGLLKEGFELCSEEVVKTVVRQAAESLTQVGCVVKETSVPMHKDDGDYFTKGVHPTSMTEAMWVGLQACSHDLHPLIKYFLLCQRHLDRQGRAAFCHAKGRNLVHDLDWRYEVVLGEEVDVLVMPTTPRAAPEIPPADVGLSDLAKHCWSNNVNTIAFNLTGHPAISVNAGFSPPDPAQGKGRLPIGAMIVGKKFDEVTVLQIARALEKLNLECY